MTGYENVAENLVDRIRQHADVVVAHDTVHPDRGACGGIGGCALMRAEHLAEVEIITMLKREARAGHMVTDVEVVPR